MKNKIVFASVAAALLGTAAFAAGPNGMRGHAPMDFATLDVNGDGSVTLEELESIPATKFAEADTDGDGVLSQAELEAMVSAQMAEMATNRAAMMLERMDTDGDGVLSADEMQPADGRGPAAMFERVDADGDGVLTEEEFAAAAERMGGHGGDRGKGHGPRGDHGVRGEGHGPRGQADVDTDTETTE